MEIIKSLNNIEFDLLYLAFKEAFKDYEMQLTRNELYSMLHRRGFAPELSFGAFEKDKLVSFTFNGIGLYNNLKTAYDTGTGTIEKYRGKGLATSIFRYSLPYLKKANIENYLLEVLQHNTKAISIYENLGFEIKREFNYFVQKNEKVKLQDKQLTLNYSIKSIDLPEYEIVNNLSDFVPSWQNSFDAITRKLDDFKIFGAFNENELVGYCILEPKTGDITQIAVNKLHRRKGLGSLLLTEILKHNQYHSIKIINTPIDCNSITKFLESQGISITGKQYEMIKKI
jgi:ribosomal protein S18 acetylase RimI-like enzyme